MHFSRMRKPAAVAISWGVSASVHAGIPPAWAWTSLGVGLETPWVLAWRPPLEPDRPPPPGCGPGEPPTL